MPRVMKPLGCSRIEVAREIVQYFERNALKVPKSCFLGVAIIHCPILKGIQILNHLFPVVFFVVPVLT